MMRLQKHVVVYRNMSWFPDEIVEEIISWLPVKCLLRLRCVSKSWLALIHSPYFVKLHLKRSVQTKINLSVFLKSHRLYRVDFDSLDSREIQPSVVDYHPFNFDQKFVLWRSCDGLICMSDLDDTVFLWNPSTRKSLKLPYESVEVSNPSNIKLGSYYGIAYTCDDYKVVRIEEITDSRDDLVDYEIMVYSLSSKSWHRSEKFPLCKTLRKVGYTLLAGALHWIIGLELEPQEKSRIVAFDLGTEKYRVIPLPEHLIDPNCFKYLHSFEGYLVFSCKYGDSTTPDAWVLKEYGGKNESWSRLTTMLPISRANMFLESITHSIYGEEILPEANCKVVYLHDLEQYSLKYINVLGMEEEEDFFEGFTCLESLVSVDDVAATVTIVKNPQEDEKKRQSSSEQ